MKKAATCPQRGAVPEKAKPPEEIELACPRQLSSKERPLYLELLNLIRGVRVVAANRVYGLHYIGRVAWSGVGGILHQDLGITALDTTAQSTKALIARFLQEGDVLEGEFTDDAWTDLGRTGLYRDFEALSKRVEDLLQDDAVVDRFCPTEVLTLAELNA
jgi:hypothetical protein